MEPSAIEVLLLPEKRTRPAAAAFESGKGGVLRLAAVPVPPADDAYAEFTRMPCANRPHTSYH